MPVPTGLGGGNVMGPYSAGQPISPYSTYGKTIRDKINKRLGTVPEKSLYEQFQETATATAAANKAREAEIRQTYANLIAQSETGGAAKVAGLAEIERGKTQAIGAGTQQMISSGLYGTTTAASIPVQAENQASLSRLKLEDILQQRTQALKLGQAGFVERIEEPYPDYNALMQAMVAQGSM